MKKNLVVFTGAGIDAESGISTFRDSGGLWEKYNVKDVATPMGFLKNTELVLDFYNQRRNQIKECIPNLAHTILSELQEDFDVQIITQNISDLHKRAGSKNILHLHGEIFKMRSVYNEHIIYNVTEDIKVGDLADDGGQLRPDIVWFTEDVPKMNDAVKVVSHADIFVVIGTSLNVYPAANVLDYVKINTPVFILDKEIPDISGFFDPKQKVVTIKKLATEGILILKEQLDKLK